MLISSCNLQTCWDLWWNGDPSKQCAPFRFIKGIDLPPSDKKNQAALAKARRVIEKLISLLGSDVGRAIASSSIIDRRNYFQTALLKFYHELYPMRTEDDFDRYHW
jgi:hypothetical protein